jgi:type I restriction enzyme S subunit
MENNMTSTEQNRSVPQLRFPEFEYNWATKKIKNIFSIFNGYAFSSSDSVDNGTLWVKIADVGIQEMKTDSLSYLPNSFIEKHTKFTLKTGDYVVALTRPILSGKLKVARINEFFNNSLLNQRVGKLISNENLDYVYYLLQNKRLIKSIENNISGSDPPNLSPHEINNIKVALPTLPEQTRIATFLTAVDKRINQLQKKKAELEQYKKGVMQKIFAREIRFKDENGNDFPDWEEKKIKELFNFKQGVQCGIKKQCLNQNDGQVRFIRIVDLTKADEPIRYIDDPGEEHHVNNNDLFMVRYGNAGLIGYNYQGVIANNLFRILPINKELIYNKFYFFVFKMMQIKLEALASSSTMPALNFKALESLKLPYLKKAEQQKIASFLSAIDKKIEKTEQQIEASQQWKQGLLQKMFV